MKLLATIGAVSLAALAGAAWVAYELDKAFEL